jgi:hypothetical protein
VTGCFVTISELRMGSACGLAASTPQSSWL